MTPTKPDRSAENGKRAACDYVAISSAIASLRYCAAVSSLQSGPGDGRGAEAGPHTAPAAPAAHAAADRATGGL